MWINIYDINLNEKVTNKCLNKNLFEIFYKTEKIHNYYHYYTRGTFKTFFKDKINLSS